jgi:hypothetical protein
VIEANSQIVGARRWHRALATRIVIQAFRDLRSQGVLPCHRDSAREFLTGSPMLRYWCHVGALDLLRIEKVARLSCARTFRERPAVAGPMPRPFVRSLRCR